MDENCAPLKIIHKFLHCSFDFVLEHAKNANPVHAHASDYKKN